MSNDATMVDLKAKMDNLKSKMNVKYRIMYLRKIFHFYCILLSSGHVNAGTDQ